MEIAQSATLATCRALDTSGCSSMRIEPRGERVVPMKRMRKRVAERLKDAQNTYAMLSTFNEVDMTNLTEMRCAELLESCCPFCPSPVSRCAACVDASILVCSIGSHFGSEHKSWRAKARMRSIDASGAPLCVSWAGIWIVFCGVARALEGTYAPFYSCETWMDLPTCLDRTDMYVSLTVAGRNTRMLSWRSMARNWVSCLASSRPRRSR